MRKMISESGTVLNVVEHIITTNFWEFYILANEPDTHAPDPDIVFALVMGDYTELGDVYLPEIEPHIISRTTQLDEIAPAAGYRWQDEAVLA